MTSNHLTPRTYSAPTCTLIVATKADRLATNATDRQLSVDNFSLHLDHLDRGELDRVTLQGNERQLDRLQQIVSKYIADLVAKFPVPTGDAHRPEPAPSPLPAVEPSANGITDRSPDRQSPSPKFGLMQNLPGLRNRALEEHTPPAAAPETESAPNASPSSFSAKNISKLLGRRQPEDRQNPPRSTAAQQPEASIVNRASDNQPYLTGGNRSLDHQLHFGELATPTSGQNLTLSAIQLFDLSTILDEYAADKLESAKEDRSPASANLLGGSTAPAIGAEDRPQVDVDSTTTALSRLPNLPKVPTNSPPESFHYQNRRRRSSFMSAMPWAAAAAVAVGTPLLLFTPQSNPLKDSLGKVKVPNFLSTEGESGKTPIASRLPGAQPGQSGSATGAPNQNNLPQPWQAKPVQPPQASPSATNPNDPNPQPSSKIGIAPLPSEIVGGSTPDLSNPMNGVKVGVAPNPLSSSPVGTVDGAASGTRLPSGKTTAKTPSPASGIPPAAKQPLGTAPLSPLARPQTPSPGKVSISTQPLPNLPQLPVDLKTSSIGKPTPFPQLDKTGVGQGTAAPLVPQTPKKAVKPKVRPKPSSSTAPAQIDPSARQTNPNLITAPESGNPNGAGIDAQPPSLGPESTSQANSAVSSDPADNPSLQETKRYFQGKWKADPTQANSLQYVVEVSGKSGVVRSVEPQGEAATTYLDRTKLIEKGQKLVSPVAGSSDQKIRVLLQPNGNVDTFVEP